MTMPVLMTLNYNILIYNDSLSMTNDIWQVSNQVFNKSS